MKIRLFSVFLFTFILLAPNVGAVTYYMVKLRAADAKNGFSLVGISDTKLVVGKEYIGSSPKEISTFVWDVSSPDIIRQEFVNSSVTLNNFGAQAVTTNGNVFSKTYSKGDVENGVVEWSKGSGFKSYSYDKNWAKDFKWAPYINMNLMANRKGVFIQIPKEIAKGSFYLGHIDENGNTKEIQASGSYSSINSINDQLESAGTGYILKGNVYQSVPFYWNMSKTEPQIINLPVPFERAGSTSINDRGFVLGSFKDKSDQLIFIWHKDGFFKTIKTDWVDTEKKQVVLIPLKLNDSNEFVGRTGHLIVFGPGDNDVLYGKAFVYNPFRKDGVIYDLNGNDENGMPLVINKKDSEILNGAIDINHIMPHGYIIGDGYDFSKKEHFNYVLIPLQM